MIDREIYARGVFERFTEQARHVVVYAQEESRLLNHDYIGSEHLLLGLLHQEESTAGTTLGRFGVTLQVARTQVERLVGRGGLVPSGHIPFTPQAKKVLERSLRESLQLGDNQIGPEHLLLGLIREGDDVVVQVFERFGVDVIELRQAVIHAMRDLRDTDEADGDPDER